MTMDTLEPLKDFWPWLFLIGIGFVGGFVRHLRESARLRRLRERQWLLMGWRRRVTPRLDERPRTWYDRYAGMQRERAEQRLRKVMR